MPSPRSSARPPRPLGGLFPCPAQDTCAAADGIVVATGGGARSTAYRQVLADTLGVPIESIDAPEATSRGAAIQAAAVLEGASIAEVRNKWTPPVVSRTEPAYPPDPDVAHRYAALTDLTQPEEQLNAALPSASR